MENIPGSIDGSIGLTDVLEDRLVPDIEDRLTKLRPQLERFLSWKFPDYPERIEDFVQIGIIKAWHQLKKEPTRPDKDLITFAKHGVIDEVLKARTLKRGGGVRDISLNKEQFVDEEGHTLMDNILVD